MDEVLPYLVENTVSFKLPATLDGFVLLNSGTAGRTQIGKSLTIYAVNDDSCRSICLMLDKMWRSDRSPVVPFDLSLNSVSSVYLRYGALIHQEVMIDACGRYIPAIRSLDGTLIEDRRNEPTKWPVWASLPPVACTAVAMEDVSAAIYVDSRVYYPLRQIYSAAKGEVRLGACGSTASPVIIKTAYKGVLGDLMGLDAIDRLANEFRVLSSLQLLGGQRIAPTPMGFVMNNPAVLVMEDVRGVPFIRLARKDQAGAVVAMMRAVAKLHSLGFVHRDIKLSNVLFLESTATLIDFELAAHINEPWPIMGTTRSYTPPEGMWGPVGTAVDCYALGMSLVHALVGYDPATLPLGIGRLIGVLNITGNGDYVTVFANLTNCDPSKRTSAAGASQSLNVIEATAPQSHKQNLKRICSNRRWAARAASESARSTVAFRKRSANGYAWQNNHFFSEYHCAGINLGAAGIVLGLATIATALGQRGPYEDVGPTVDWLVSQKPFHDAHGLFTGNAGVALAICVGANFSVNCSQNRMIALERLALAAQGVTETDLFSGAAGILWAGCLMMQITGDSASFEAVRPLAKRLIGSAGLSRGMPVCENSAQVGTLSLGAAHGLAGIGLALASWGHATSDQAALDLSISIFQTINRDGRSADGRTLRYNADQQSPPAPLGNWCHGPAGYLWCMLNAFGDETRLAAAVDWAVEAFAEANLIHTPTYCHGLAGQLELCRMLMAVPRHRDFAEHRATRIISALRLLQQRRNGLIAWSSEDPDVFTPDLWVGYLGPAAALAMSTLPGYFPLLSGTWLKLCSEMEN